MAAKNLLLPFKIASGMDLSANAVSAVSEVKSIDLLSVQINATGTFTGEFFVEGSIDESADPKWVALTLTPPAQVSGGAPSEILINLRMAAFTRIRVRYAAISGSGTADIIIAGKGL